MKTCLYLQSLWIFLWKWKTAYSDVAKNCFFCEKFRDFIKIHVDLAQDML